MQPEDVELLVTQEMLFGKQKGRTSPTCPATISTELPMRVSHRVKLAGFWP
jgi:hypothetical protein